MSWSNEVPTFTGPNGAEVSFSIDRYAYTIVTTGAATDTIALSVNLSCGSMTSPVARFAISLPSGFVAACPQRFHVAIRDGGGAAYSGEAYIASDADTGELIADKLVISKGGGTYLNQGGTNVFAQNNVSVAFCALIEVAAAA